VALWEEVAQALVSRGFCEKALMVEETASCGLIYCKRGTPLLIAVAEHNDWVYAKAVAESVMQPHMWHCAYVFYNPYGLYSFAESIEELAAKIEAKVRHVEAQAKLAQERLLPR